jgi:hypothetical protein
MSVTVSNCNSICNAPTNLSSAKMLYSFPKQSRFLKRKTILYLSSYQDAIASIKLKIPSPPEAPALATDPNTTLRKNRPPHPRQIHITSPTMNVAPITSMGSPSERADKR